MTALDVTKQVVSIVVGMGTSKIVSGIIKNNTDPTTVIDKVTMVAGSYVLGAIVAEASRDYTNAKIDEIAATYRTQVDKFRKK